MSVRRSFAAVGAVFCAHALFGCSGADSEEDVAQVAQPFSYNFANKLSGKLSNVTSVAASRGAGLLDLFTIYDAGFGFTTIPYYRFRDGIGWSSGVTLNNPPSRPWSLAVTENGGRIDLFAAGQNGKVYHKISAPGTGALTWVVDWYEVPGATAKNPTSGNAITVTSWGDGRLDLFWVTPAGNLGHKWMDNFAWSGTETGDATNSPPYLRPIVGGPYTQGIESVSTGPGRLDVVLGSHGTTPGLKHHFFHGFWGIRAIPCCRDVDGNQLANVNNFALMPLQNTGQGPFDFELYVNLRRSGNQTRLHRFVNWEGPGFTIVNGLAQADDASDPIPNANEASFLTDGFMWTSNGARKDIFGLGRDNLAWRMFF